MIEMFLSNEQCTAFIIHCLQNRLGQAHPSPPANYDSAQNSLSSKDHSQTTVDSKVKGLM